MNTFSFFCLFNDFSIQEYDSIENCINSETKYIIKTWFVETCLYDDGNTYKIIDYLFLDKHGIEVLPKFSNWKVIELGKSEIKISSNRFDTQNSTLQGIGCNKHLGQIDCGRIVKIADKSGLIKSVVIFGFEDLLEFIKNLKTYGLWIEYELSTKNQRLENENKVLRQELSYLEQEIGYIIEKFNTLTLGINLILKQKNTIE
jgi:hypothetical protein